MGSRPRPGAACPLSQREGTHVQNHPARPCRSDARRVRRHGLSRRRRAARPRRRPPTAASTGSPASSTGRPDPQRQFGGSTTTASASTRAFALEAIGRSRHRRPAGSATPSSERRRLHRRRLVRRPRQQVRRSDGQVARAGPVHRRRPDATSAASTLSSGSTAVVTKSGPAEGPDRRQVHVRRLRQHHRPDPGRARPRPPRRAARPARPGSSCSSSSAAQGFFRLNFAKPSAAHQSCRRRTPPTPTRRRTPWSSCGRPARAHPELRAALKRCCRLARRPAAQERRVRRRHHHGDPEHQQHRPRWLGARAHAGHCTSAKAAASWIAGFQVGPQIRGFAARRSARSRSPTTKAALKAGRAGRHHRRDPGPVAPGHDPGGAGPARSGTAAESVLRHVVRLAAATLHGRGGGRGPARRPPRPSTCSTGVRCLGGRGLPPARWRCPDVL